MHVQRIEIYKKAPTPFFYI